MTLSTLKNLNFVIKSWLVITYKGLNRWRIVSATYLDLNTDLILVGAVMTSLAGTSYFDNIFAYQVAIILLLSIIVPLFTSALIMAWSTPLVILKAKRKDYKEQTLQIFASMKDQGLSFYSGLLFNYYRRFPISPLYNFFSLNEG